MGEERSLEDLKKEHGLLVGSRLQAPMAEAQEQSPYRNYVRDLVLGFNDGLVSVFAVTAGVAGAGTGQSILLITGIAAATAGAFSMAAGEYISTKSQAEFYESERRRESEHLDRWPELERQELRESLAAKGIKEPLLGDVVDSIAADKGRFLDYMMRDEFGVGSESLRSPARASFLVAIAFLVGSVFPVAPYALIADQRSAILASAVLSLAGLFLAGAVRARTSRLPIIRAGIEMVVIGALAAGATYGIGRLVGANI